MTPDTYSEFDLPPGAIEAGDFVMLGETSTAHLMVVKKVERKFGGYHWLMRTTSLPSAEVDIAERAGEFSPLGTGVYIQRDGSLIRLQSPDQWVALPFSISDTVPLGLNMKRDADPADPGEVFDRAYSAADKIRKQ